MNSKNWKLAALTTLLIGMLVPAQLAGGDCDKDCSDMGECISNSEPTGAGLCTRTVTIEIDEAGQITKKMVCETEAGPCGDFGPIEY